MKLQKLFALPALMAAVVACMCAPQPAAAQTVPNRITQNVASSKLISLNDRPTQLKNAVDLGRIAPATPINGMVLVLQPSPQQQQALATLMKQQQQVGSPEYHKWLTPQQFGEQFGISQDDLKQITGWLQSEGFHVDRVSNSRRWIVFSGISSQVEQAFHTQLHKFSLKGAAHLANSTATSIPQALTPVVRGVMSLNDFFSKPNLVFDKKPRAMTTLSNGQYALSPVDYATIYDINPVYKAGINGAGQTVAIVGRSDVDPVDIQDFTALFGTHAIDLNTINNGPDPGMTGDSDQIEQTLDVTWAGSVASGATIDLVVTGSTATTDGVILSMAYIVDNDLAPIMSTSYGSCEALEGQAYASYFAVLHEQAAAEGISSFVSAGDSGGAGCDNPDTETAATLGFGINGVASSPYNVAVGGTEFLDQANPSQYWSPNNDQNGASALSYIPEMAWNESSPGVSIDAGGGGSSIFYGKPLWQTGTGVPQDGARDIPDISLTASLHDGYIICLRSLGGDCSQGFFFVVGGTSAASPSFAGIMALINQKTNTSWGNPAPIIYSLANGSNYNKIFHDTTVGNNMVPAASGNMIGYDAGAGYDLATGWGSVDVNQLVNAWVATGMGLSGVSLTVNGGTTPITVTHGTLLTLASAVSPAVSPIAPTPPVATGDIAYVANSSSGNTALGVATLSAGATSLQTPTLPGGTQTITAHYAGDANYTAQLSGSVTVTVTPENSVTNIGSGTSPTIQYGMSKDLDAFVASGSNANLSPNSGTVTFNDGSNILSKVPITGGELPPSTTLGGAGGVYGSFTGGAATYTVPYLTVGSHNITATFSGNASYNPSTSAALPVTVTQVPSNLTIVAIESSVLQPLMNTRVALSASVALANGGSATAPITGTFTFYDGANTLGTGTISGQSSPGLYAATLDTTFTTSGAHYIYAVYNGDANVQGGAASSAVTLTVGIHAATQTVLLINAAAEPVTPGDQIDLTANVTGSSSSPTVTGTVTFYDGTTSLGTAPVINGLSATLTTSSLAGGTHNIYAAYGGNSTFLKSQSQVTQFVINDFTLTPGSSSTSVVAGSSAAVPITVTALGVIPTAVSLTCGGLPSGAACSLSPSKVTPGSGSVVSTMVISTAGPTLSPAARSTTVHAALDSSHVKPGSSGMALRFGGAFFLGLPLFGLGWTRKRKFLTAIFSLVGLAVLLGAMGMSGCGGSGSGGQKYTITNPGTPAGTSTVTVTATTTWDALTITHTTTVSLTVQSAVPGTM